MQKVDLAGAVEVLSQGKILVYPTETCYGLGVDPEQPSAMADLLQLKGRDFKKPISLLLPSVSHLVAQAQEISPMVQTLMDQFLPGPLTIVIKTKVQYPQAICGESGEVGFRVSSHPRTQALMALWGRPLTTTSANPAGQPSGHSLKQLEAYFGSCDGVYFLDAGELPPSLGSTVVRVTGSDLQLLRLGDIALENFNP